MLIKKINQNPDYVATDISQDNRCKIIQVESISNNRYVVGYIVKWRQNNKATCETEEGFHSNKAGKEFIKFCKNVLNVQRKEV